MGGKSSLIVYYEALLLRPSEETSRLAQYLGLGLEPRSIDHVTESLSVPSMKKMEAEACSLNIWRHLPLAYTHKCVHAHPCTHTPTFTHLFPPSSAFRRTRAHLRWMHTHQGLSQHVQTFPSLQTQHHLDRSSATRLGKKVRSAGQTTFLDELSPKTIAICNQDMAQMLPAHMIATFTELAKQRRNHTGQVRR